MTHVHPLYRASQHQISLPLDPRGRAVFDAQGTRIGHVHDVFYEEIPAETQGGAAGVSPRYLEVGSGGRFHLHNRSVLVDYDQVAISADGVYIDASRFDLFGPEDTLPALPKPFDPGN